MRRSDARDDAALHAVSASSVGALTLLVGGALWLWGDVKASAGTTGPDLSKFETVEASLAYKKTSPQQKQPQKQRQAPPPETKPQGVSRDETRLPDPAKPDDPAKPVDQPQARPDDGPATMPTDDEPIGEPTEDRGEFDGSEFGNADVSSGDEYYQQLLADMRWEFPELLKGEGTPVGCIHIERDGTIPEIKLYQPSGNAELDDSVERALKNVKKARDDKPVPVPERLHRQITRWICFKFAP
jgi:outer membrane biosynthesis protein TonB